MNQTYKYNRKTSFLTLPVFLRRYFKTCKEPRN
jgi:hypothetical protein